MRQLLLIASVVGLFMYAGFAIQFGAVPVAHGEFTTVESLTGLQRALRATGAELDRVVITGWVPVEGPHGREYVAGALGWQEEQNPANEFRELSLHKRDHQTYLSARWEMTGSSTMSWAARQGALRRALLRVGSGGTVTVQLEGVTHRTDLLAAANQALDVVRAQHRQEWSDSPAASLSGQSADLPPSTFGVNIQAALRRETTTGATRVWVAWPALLQDF